MLRRTRSPGFRPLAVAAVALLATGAANAATLTLGLDVEFSGGTAPGSLTTPWVTATFDDSFGGANTVRLTMVADNLTGGEAGENIAGFYFNFDPLLDATLLTFTAIENGASVPNAINTGTNAFQADGDGFFDILFDFPPPPGNGGARFTEGETIIYDLTYVAPIDASSFLYSSVMGGGTGTFQSAAHILRTRGGNDSGWIGVAPEPGTAALFALGLTALGLRRRRT